MPFTLHPSGFCAHFSAQGSNNLSAGVPCPFCGRIVGHKTDCQNFKPVEDGGKSSRPKLYNAAAILWGKSPVANLVTFTLPSISAGRYQRDPDCPETGDIVIAQKFSKVLEAWTIKTKRAGGRLSYVWVSERQQKRAARYGGAGELHYHVLVNQQIKDNAGNLTHADTLENLQYNWCNQLGVKYAANCIDVRPLPDWVKSVPAYLAKYLGKGKQGAIYSRRFAATRDLTKYSPIHLTQLPPHIDLETTTTFETPDGFEVTAYYYNTRQVLEAYAGAMEAIHATKSPPPGKAEQWTTEAIRGRAIKRQIAALYPHRGLSYPS